MPPKVSVVMPNYNGEKFIAKAIESILEQTFTDLEFIIIDDGSTDGSWNIIQDYAKKDARIIALKNPENLKICKTLNRGIEIAQGEYIARMDSDDIANPNWIENIYLKMKSDINIGLCGCNFIVVDEAGRKIFEKKFPQSDQECRSSIWFRNPFAHNTVLYKKELIKKVGGYNEEFLYAEDLELWIRIGQHSSFYNLQENLVQYRIYGSNSILKKQKLMIENTLKARKEAIKLGYKITFKGWVFYIGTWGMQFFPPKFVLWLFNVLNK